MVHTPEEIINALQVIKDECDEIFSDLVNRNCTECPLSKTIGTCTVNQKIPTNWHITPTVGVWKAFEED